MDPYSKVSKEIRNSLQNTYFSVFLVDISNETGKQARRSCSVFMSLHLNLKLLFECKSLSLGFNFFKRYDNSGNGEFALQGY